MFIDNIRSMIPRLIVSFLCYWPHDKLINIKSLVDAELKRRKVKLAFYVYDPIEPDECHESHHDCCGHDDDDDDIDDDGFNPEELNSIASRIYEPVVPGTVKESFYDVWVEFNDLVSTRYQQLTIVEKIVDTLALSNTTEQNLFRQLQRDKAEKLSSRIVKLPILSQDQLDTLLEAEPKINHGGWSSVEGKMMFDIQMFTLTHSLIVD